MERTKYEEGRENEKGKRQGEEGKWGEGRGGG